MQKLLFRTAAGRSMALALIVLAFAGCAGLDESQDGEDGRRARQRPASPTSVNLALAAPTEQVRTIQLYRGADEAQLPVLELGRGERLSLEFDLLAEQGRPLSVYFYHADRTWRRDLTPAEYLSSFQRDDILDYQMSMATEVPYVHYTYRFPNDNIEFRISGNYVIRVTEQGMEDEVLYERAFFVTEQSANLDFYMDQVMLGGSGFPTIQPHALFTPPQGTRGNVFDYNVCFVRNGRYDLARCADRPYLAQQPALQFYLEPEYAFEPEGAGYFLDLSALRVDNQIAETDLAARPHRVVLEPDYARFGGDAPMPLLNGQTVVSSVVRDVADADVSAEYVRVRFSYVPENEQPIASEVLLTGSFNDWKLDPANRLAWVAENGRYEGDLLLKQGYYEYRYATRGRRFGATDSRTMPRAENQYAAFVYYRDLHINTDRLLAVRSLVGP